VGAVSLDCLKRHLPESLELMADVLFPSFPTKSLRLRKQRLDGSAGARSPGAIAGKRCGSRSSAALIPMVWWRRRDLGLEMKRRARAVLPEVLRTL
jgi:hypothetical protein